MRHILLSIVLFSSTSVFAFGLPELFPAADGGGVSGGGGFFIKPHPADGYADLDAKNVVKKAFQYIYDISEKYEENGARSKSPDVLNKFLSNVNLHGILERVKPLVYEAGPCLNKYYENVDGSLYSFKPNTICVSAFSLKQKVAEKDMFPQSVGILIHEYSEVLGMTDEEANSLQTIIIDEVRASQKNN